MFYWTSLRPSAAKENGMNKSLKAVSSISMILQ